MPPFLDLIITGVISFALGGGVYALRKTKNEARHVEVQSDVLERKTTAELHDLSISGLIKVNEALQQQIDRQQKELDRAHAETARERAEKETYRDELAGLYGEVDRLRIRIAELMERLEDQEYRRDETFEGED